MHVDSSFPRPVSRLGVPESGQEPAIQFVLSERVFVAQVLPQLLYFLKVGDGDDALDFSTIAVYTCSESCALRGTGGGNEGYAEEIAWVQVGA